MSKQFIYSIPTDDLYWKKEEVCDRIFKLENRIQKAKTKKTKNKFIAEFMEILETLKIFEKRIAEVL